MRTRFIFILNNFSGIGLGVPGPPPPLATPMSVDLVGIAEYWVAAAGLRLSAELHKKLSTHSGAKVGAPISSPEIFLGRFPQLFWL